MLTRLHCGGRRRVVVVVCGRCVVVDATVPWLVAWATPVCSLEVGETRWAPKLVPRAAGGGYGLCRFDCTAFVALLAGDLEPVLYRTL